jgi:hypothetical protein
MWAGPCLSAKSWANRRGLDGGSSQMVYFLSRGGANLFHHLFDRSIAETNRTPFDIAEAESELTSGFHTEYSGMKWAMFFMAEYAYMFLACALGAVLFLGGGAPIHPSFVFIPSYVWFFGKVFLAFLFILGPLDLPSHAGGPVDGVLLEIPSPLGVGQCGRGGVSFLDEEPTNEATSKKSFQVALGLVKGTDSDAPASVHAGHHRSIPPRKTDALGSVSRRLGLSSGDLYFL